MTLFYRHKQKFLTNKNSLHKLSINYSDKMSQKAKTTPKPSPKNTLFSYFQKKTPATDEKTPKINETSELKEEASAKKTLTGKQLDFGKEMK
jgi:hypothetical protein